MLEALLVHVCSYEAIALRLRKWPRVSRYVPPITRVVYGCRTRPLPYFLASLVGVVSMLAALGWHLLADGWDD